jgi:hypothetical protein
MQRRIIGGLALIAAVALSAPAQTPSTKRSARNVTPAKATQSQTAKPVKAAKTAPKSDFDIQTCIEQKLATAPKLKDQGFSVAVSGGVATFTGAAKNGGSKGNAGGTAKSCGANRVVNNISVEKMAKTKH